MHHGSLLVITNKSHSLFAIQQKDELYRPHPQGFCFWGGEVEAGEIALEAVKRETTEELPEQADEILQKDPIFMFQTIVTHNKSEFRASLFGCEMPDEFVNGCGGWQVGEGEGAVLVPRDDLADLDWVWGLEQLVPLILAWKSQS